MSDVEAPPLPVVDFGFSDQHHSWRLWADRRTDIRTVVKHLYPMADSTLVHCVLSLAEFLQCSDQATFDRYVRNAVKAIEQRGEG